MRGGKTVNAPLIDAWRDALERAGITDEVLSLTVEAVVISQPSFPSLDEFISRARGVKPDDGSGYTYCYNVECHHCGLTVAAPRDNSLRPVEQNWVCPRCRTLQNVSSTDTDRRDLQLPALGKEGVAALCKRIRRLYAGDTRKGGMTRVGDVAEPPIKPSEKSVAIEKMSVYIRRYSTSDEAIERWVAWSARPNVTAARIDQAISDLEIARGEREAAAKGGSI